MASNIAATYKIFDFETKVIETNRPFLKVIDLCHNKQIADTSVNIREFAHNRKNTLKRKVPVVKKFLTPFSTRLFSKSKQFSSRGKFFPLREDRFLKGSVYRKTNEELQELSTFEK